MSNTTIDPSAASDQLYQAISSSVANVKQQIDDISGKIDTAQPQVQSLNQSLADTINQQGAIQKQAYTDAQAASSKIQDATALGGIGRLIGLFDSDYNVKAQQAALQTSMLRVQGSQNTINNARDATQAGIAVANAPVAAATQKLQSTAQGLSAQTTAASGESTAQETSQRAKVNLIENMPMDQLQIAAQNGNGLAQQELTRRQTANVQLAGEQQQVAQQSRINAVTNASQDQLQGWVDNPKTMPAGVAPGLVQDELHKRNMEPLQLDALGQAVKTGAVELQQRLKANFLQNASSYTLMDLANQASQNSKPGVDGVATVQTAQGPVTFTAPELQASSFARQQAVQEMQGKLTQQQVAVATTAQKAGEGDNQLTNLAAMNGGSLPPDILAKMQAYQTAIKTASNDPLTLSKVVDDRNTDLNKYVTDTAKTMDPELQGAWTQKVNTGTLDPDAASKAAFHLLRNPAALTGGTMEALGPQFTTALRKASTDMGLLLGQGNMSTDDLLSTIGARKDSGAIIDRAMNATKYDYVDPADGKTKQMDMKTRYAQILAGEYFKNSMVALGSNPDGTNNNSYFSKYLAFDPVSGKATGNLSPQAYTVDLKSGAVTFSMNTLMRNMARQVMFDQANGNIAASGQSPTDVLLSYLGNKTNVSNFAAQTRNRMNLSETAISKLLMGGREDAYILPQLNSLHASMQQGQALGLQQIQHTNDRTNTAAEFLKKAGRNVALATQENIQQVINGLTNPLPQDPFGDIHFLQPVTSYAQDNQVKQDAAIAQANSNPFLKPNETKAQFQRNRFSPW